MACPVVESLTTYPVNFLEGKWTNCQSNPRVLCRSMLDAEIPSDYCVFWWVAFQSKRIGFVGTFSLHSSGFTSSWESDSLWPIPLPDFCKVICLNLLLHSTLRNAIPSVILPHPTVDFEPFWVNEIILIDWSLQGLLELDAATMFRNALVIRRWCWHGRASGNYEPWNGKWWYLNPRAERGCLQKDVSLEGPKWEISILLAIGETEYHWGWTHQ